MTDTNPAKIQALNKCFPHNTNWYKSPTSISSQKDRHHFLRTWEIEIMGNIFCCCGGRRRRSNVPQEATETTPRQPHPPKIPVNQSVSPVATSYSPPGTMWGAYNHPMPPPRDVVDEKPVTIRNDTNLKKQTLTLEQDPVNPGHLLVAFTFDALVSGRFNLITHLRWFLS